MNIQNFLNYLKLEFDNPIQEHEYRLFRRVEIQKNLNYFLISILYSMTILVLYMRDMNSTAFVLFSTFLYQLNKKAPRYALLTDCFINLQVGFLYSSDHYDFPKEEYITHIRAFIYVCLPFTISLISSYRWIYSSLS